MEVWILFICGINMNTQAVKCNAARADTQAICEFERDRVRRLVNAPLAAVCFRNEVTDEPEATESL